MRTPEPFEMRRLGKLSGVREKVAMLKLAEVARRRQTASDYVNQLRANLPSSETVEEGLVLQRWLVWRDQELKRRLSALAVVSAEYAETVQRCGRIIAENAVVEDLTEISTKAAREVRRKRQDYK